MDIFEINGEKLRELRDSLNWSREFLSEKSGVPYRTIQQLETGETENPGIYTILPILKAMAPHIPELNPTKKQRGDLILRLLNALASINDDDLESIVSLSETAASRNLALAKTK